MLFLEDRQFLVYNFGRFAYNWNKGVSVFWKQAFKENCRISDTLNQVIKKNFFLFVTVKWYSPAERLSPNPTEGTRYYH